MRFRVLATALALLALSLPAYALAHEGNPNYRSEIRVVVPDLPDVRVEVLDYDDSLRLRNGGDETVVVEGYEGEPYVRIRPDGAVEVNRRSPTHYLNEDRFAEVEVPARADPDAAPEWRRVDGSAQYEWHDHRIHYMSRGRPEQVTDEGERAKIFDYTVPLTVDGRPASIEGSLWWVGGGDEFQPAPFIGLAGVVLIAGGLVVIVRRRRGSKDPDGQPSQEAW